jgi:hypothetical protein
MRWEDEPYVRLYKRNTPEWCVLEWQARGLFALILREVDRAGILELGKLGLRAVAVAVRAPWEEIEQPLRKVLEDGMAVHQEDLRILFIPNYLQAQEAAQSDKARKRAERERARDLARAKSLKRPPSSGNGTPPSGNVTAPSENVTNGHTPSHGVTSCHSEQYSTEQNRAEQGVDAASGARPTSPEEERASRTDEAAKPSPASESGFDLAKRIWQELWTATYREPYEFTFDLSQHGDDRVLQRAGRLAEERATNDVSAEAILRHKIGAYLRDGGRWVTENRHPVRGIEKDWNKYGMPKSVTRVAKAKAAAEPVPTEEELRASAQKNLERLRGMTAALAAKKGFGS